MRKIVEARGIHDDLLTDLKKRKLELYEAGDLENIER
jgi:hypothetical protein